MKQTDLFGINNGAQFSPDRKYRYALWRIWKPTWPKVAFIGLNPSTANELENDPTIRRVQRFAADWGYGGFYMLNLFALVSTDPERVRRHDDPIGDNDKQLLAYIDESSRVVFAWGQFTMAMERSKQVIELLHSKFPGELFYCLGKTKEGSPRHPLYLKADTQLQVY